MTGAATIPPLAFIGAGNMGSAIIHGLRRLEAPPAISVCDKVATIRQAHAAAGLPVHSEPGPAVAEATVVVLAVKPQAADETLAELAEHLDERHLVVSIMAGVPCARIEAPLRDGVRVIRSMPNTPMAIGRGMVAIAPGSAATEVDLDLAESIFAPAASVLRVAEDQMDAITAVSGSGPAYLFRFAEALVAAAEALGFEPEQARTLVGTTLEGSVAYLRAEAGFPAARLRQEVTSPGGTTAAALNVLDDADFGGLIERALIAARDRSRELSA